MLAPAQRADVVIDFSGLAVGTQLVLQNLQGSGSTAQIMSFNVVRNETDTSQVPATLRAIAALNPANTRPRTGRNDNSLFMVRTVMPMPNGSGKGSGWGVG